MSAEKSTPRPWVIGFSFLEAGVNDGSHKDWLAPSQIPAGECACCANHEGVLIRSYKIAEGGNVHVHRFPNEGDWRCIYSVDGTRITGNYDYEDGGVCSSEADARLIVRAVNCHEKLVEALIMAKSYLHSHPDYQRGLMRAEEDSRKVETALKLAEADDGE